MTAASYALLERARGLVDASRAAEALHYAQQAVADDPDDPDGWLVIASAHRSLRNWLDALAAANRAISLQPDDARGHAAAAAALLRWAPAHKNTRLAAETAARLAPHWWYAQSMLALVCARSISFRARRRAPKIAALACALAPDAAGPYEMRAQMWVALRKSHRAGADAKRALARDAQSVYALALLGDLASQQRRSGAAADYYQRALSQRPSSEAIGSGLRRQPPLLVKRLSWCLFGFDLVILSLFQYEPGAEPNPGTRAAQVAAVVLVLGVVGYGAWAYRRWPPGLRSYVHGRLRRIRPIAVALLLLVFTCGLLLATVVQPSAAMMLVIYSLITSLLAVLVVFGEANGYR